MPLYRWSSEALRNYSNGDTITYGRTRWPWLDPEEVREKRGLFLTDLRKAPTEVPNTGAIFISGSE